MKLKIHKFKNNIKINEQILFTDIPTLGIAFTCVDNYCSDNNLNIITLDNLQIKYPVESIWITTIKNNQVIDDYDILFEIIK